MVAQFQRCEQLQAFGRFYREHEARGRNHGEEPLVSENIVVDIGISCVADKARVDFGVEHYRSPKAVLRSDSQTKGLVGVDVFGVEAYQGRQINFLQVLQYSFTLYL